MVRHVPINNNYRIAISERNHTLERLLPGHEKDGKFIEDHWAAVGYFPNMAQCLRCLVNIELVSQDYPDLNAYIVRLEQLAEKYGL